WAARHEATVEPMKSKTVAIAAAAAAALVVIAGLAWSLVAQQRRFDRLEAQLANVAAQSAKGAAEPRTVYVAAPPAGTRAAEGAAPIGAAAPNRRDPNRPIAIEDAPRLPEVRRFVEDHQLGARDWRALQRLNDWWIETLRKVGREGEGALPDK